jgi:hypothetical protein
MKRNNDVSLSEALNLMLHAYKLKDGFMQAKLEKEWDTLMGPKLASYSKILSLRKKILRIQVTSSVLRQELTMSKEQLIQKLNDALGEQIITTIEIF